MTGIFGGGSATTDRKNQLASFGSLADTMYFGQYGPGKTDVTSGGQGLGTAQNFFTQLLQGQPGNVLGPQIKTLQDQASQQRITNTEFGNRSGGTNASNQMIDVNTQSQIDNLIASLTGTAASGEISASQALGSLGIGTLGLGASSAANLGALAGGDYQAVKQQQNANLGGLLEGAALLALG